MIWRKHLNRVLHVLINNVNILFEKATNDLLGFPNVASQAFFDSILALGIRTLGTPFECFLYLFSNAIFRELSLKKYV